MDITEKIKKYLDEGDSNGDAAVMDKVITNGRGRKNMGGPKKKKGTANSEEEAPK